MSPRPALALVAALSAAACAHVEPAWVEAGEGAMSAAETAARAAGRHLTGPHPDSPADPRAVGARVIAMPQPESIEERYAANSLWRAGSRTFFNDQRAARIGDILTVAIDIEDSAAVSNSTSRSRSGSTDVGVTNLFGKEEFLGRLLPPGGNFEPSTLVGAEGESEASGQGQINRQERVELTVAAVVTDVLPNGNFVIAGRQEVRINSEMRDLTVSGVIRPEDIAADNTIRHTQIAEARISYGGRGTISTVQRPRWGQRVVDVISPW